MVTTTQTPDPDPRVRIVADVGEYVVVMRRFADSTLREVAREDEADRRDLVGPPAPHRSWACVHQNHDVCPAARIDCSCGCHRA